MRVPAANPVLVGENGSGRGGGKLANLPLLLLSLLASALVAQSAGGQESVIRRVAVTGEAEVAGAPDLATVTLGVEARQPELETARAEVTRTVDALLALTRELGVDPQLVNATRVRIQPDYNWNEQGRERVLVGYVVYRDVLVELRELDKLGSLLAGAVDAGANSLGEPILDSSRRGELERQALELAVGEARRNAEVIAAAAGMRLGPPLVISSGGVAPGPLVFKSVAAAPSADEAQTYQPGEMRFGASVSAEFELLEGE